MQDYDITNFLNLKDENIKILSCKTVKTTKEIHFEKQKAIHYCPVCNCRMYSKGIYQRHINHPILQDGYSLELVFHQRRWQCSSPLCKEVVTDSVSFLDKRRRNTNITDMLIVQAFKDPGLTAAQIARQFKVSDTYALHTFDRYVDLPRRTLTEAICIDEVHLNISKTCKYALVILDFATGEPIDLVISRRQQTTEPYFASIPPGERAHVKYIVSDMYGPFLDYPKTYFPNAVSAIDSFHVIKLINYHIRRYLQRLLRKLNGFDLARQRHLEEELGHRVDLVHSREYSLVKHNQWLILSNNRNIDYGRMRWDFRLKRYVYPSDIERELFKIDPNLKSIRDLKEKYIKFNNDFLGDTKGAREGLKRIIREYRECPFPLFYEVADSLNRHFDEIINSFILVDKYNNKEIVKVRLSNGVMESMNRIPKDMKRNGRGYRNFQHIRNRYLYAMRENAAILGTPKSWKEVCFKTGRKRGSYNKVVKGPKLKK